MPRCGVLLWPVGVPKKRNSRSLHGSIISAPNRCSIFGRFLHVAKRQLKNSNSFRFCRGVRYPVYCAGLHSNSSSNANADNVGPALHEIEQMRVEQGANDILHHNDKTDPFGKAIASE